MVSKTKKTSGTHRSSHLLLPSTMRDFASCFSEHAVRVSDSSCSSSSGAAAAFVPDPSIQSAVCCLYRTRLLTQKELFINVTWSKTHDGPAVSVAIDDDTSSRPLKGKKGRRSFVSGDSVVGLYWDLSSAKYGPGPEPIEGFCIALIVNEEFALLLGEMSRDFIMEFKERMMPTAEFSMVSRREQIVGCNLYSTKARFCRGGRDHDITIKCRRDGSNTAADSELSVCVDKKRVLHVTKLEYNFRGNQTVFMDGSPVDLMWDVHGWRFSGPSGCAMFLFRTRSALQSRLWLEEMMNEEPAMSGFSLMIQASKDC